MIIPTLIFDVFTQKSQKESSELTERFSQFPSELDGSHEVHWNPVEGDQEFRDVDADEKHVELCLKLEKIVKLN